MKYAGVDLGKKGGIVIIKDGNVIVNMPMPVIKSSKKSDEYDIDRIVDVFLRHLPDYTYIEKALLLPVSGKKSYQQSGFVEGGFQFMLASLKLRYDVITPKRWQKNIFEGMNKKDTKQASIMFAKRMYPAVDWKSSPKSSKYHDGMTDALCIAEYCKRING